MPLNPFRLISSDGVEGEVRVEAEISGLRRKIPDLEQIVSEHFAQLREPVYHYLIAVFGYPGEAEEIVQEAFLRLIRALDEGQTIQNVRSWVFRVAHNLAIKRIKSRQFVAPLDERSWEELAQTLADAGPNPEENALRRERLARLHAALARLNLQERECLHLRLKGLRYREIAEILGIGVSTVAEALARVIAKLSRETNG